MTCFQAKTYARLALNANRRNEAMLHASQCRQCQSDLQADVVLERLLDVSEPTETAPSADFYAQIRHRIDRELMLQKTSKRGLSGNWEGAVLQFQNWVYAGSAAAILAFGFVLYSGGFAPQTLTGRDRLSDAMISQRSDRMVLTRPDPLSQDEVLYALMSEDY